MKETAVAAESSKSRAVIRPEEKARERAGELLQRRRSDLGFGGRRRRAFARDRGVNDRLLTDIENPQPGRNYLISSIQDIARAYGVTYESLAAVLRGDADGLVPAQPAPAPAAAAFPAGLPPLADAGRLARAAPHLARIWERVWALAARGVTDPSGAEVFGEGTAGARAWDSGIAQRWPVPERVWLLADFQASEPGPGAARDAGGAAG
jgi:hypothetical protein